MKSRTRPAQVPILWDVRLPRIEALSHALGRHVRAGDLDAALGRAPKAGDRVDQLALAVAVHPRERRRSLPRGRRRRRRGRRRGRARRARSGPRPGAAARPARTASSRPGAAPRGRPSSREPRLGGALAGDRLDLLPAPEDRDPVGDLEHLVELVADEDDRQALVRERAQDLEQLLASCGVSTAVGSSRIRMSALR